MVLPAVAYYNLEAGIILRRRPDLSPRFPLLQDYPMPQTRPPAASFSELNLPAALLEALEAVGYETPTPIQAQAIPPLLEGSDLLGHAPTGTGKTAAFALPLLSRIDLGQQNVQVMVLAPTRELAIQVAEAFQRYAVHMKGFHVLPVYGGQEYGGQIRALKRGVHVVVGTPGRVMDHMRKGTLDLSSLRALVLDEADEMLRMGFIDDVDWILEQSPAGRQMALFSATLPEEIQRIARRHLREPREIAIESLTATAATIRQRYWPVSHLHKLDALTRILEVEPFDALLMFVRTKIATVELADRLEARGYSAAALNGDMPQAQREQMIERLKNGKLDILVATDVAARGLDVDRISHVVNYDIPHDTEAYIHRIGRTGRAGRVGDAILFVAPRERRMLGAIEQATRQKIEQMELPSTEIVNNKRIADFKQKITDTLAREELDFMQGLLEQYRREHDVPSLEIAAALAKMFLGDTPLLLAPDQPRPARKSGGQQGERSGRGARSESGRRDDADRRARRKDSKIGRGWDTYRIEVGREHRVKPGNIVGAIANEAGLDSQYIGSIDIQDHYSLVDLPKDMPEDVFLDLKSVRVQGQTLNISRVENPSRPVRKKPGKTGANRKPHGKPGKKSTKKANKTKR
jgi:ATP-dependent RNA helicase DeaD